MNDKVLNFIEKRFKNDCDWMTNNCYYFAIILKDRFPEGKIFYDVIYGHFIFWFEGKFYDWNGIVESNGYCVEWDKFDEYDFLQRQRIIRDCIL